MRRSMTFTASEHGRAQAIDSGAGAPLGRHARGMRASTEANPYQLTTRELDVLLLLCEG